VDTSNPPSCLLLSCLLTMVLSAFWAPLNSHHISDIYPFWRPRWHLTGWPNLLRVYFAFSSCSPPWSLHLCPLPAISFH
jgi:hypothetical protein